jgi:hypothetical protein
MKKIFIPFLYAILIVLSIETIGQPTVTFKMDNPRIFRGGPNGTSTGTPIKTRFQFDVYIKASASGTYLYATQLGFYINGTYFTQTQASISVDLSPLSDSSYYYLSSGKGFSGSNSFGVGITADVSAWAGSPAQDFCMPVTTSFKKIAVIGVEITTAGVTGIAGITFNLSAMYAGPGGLQEYAEYDEILVSSYTSHKYAAPVSADGRTFADTYLGRIYSSAWGWSQHSSTIAGQSLAWGTSVNTSVWDGNATITQTDNTAAMMTSLRIDNVATLTVPANKWLTVSGTLNNTGTAAGLVVESGGSLLQSTASVPATVKRYIGNWTAGVNKGWHLISSPVSAQPFQPSFVTNPPDATQDFYLWDEPTGFWINSKLGSGPFTFNSAAFGTNFELGKGYLCAYATDQTKEFSGGYLNVTDQPRSCSFVGPGAWSDKGWNLLGNPYTCALAWNNGSWAMTNIDAMAQIWSETFASYTVINTSGIIPAMQGFMVRANATSASVTIPIAARQHSTQAWYKTTQNPFIKLVAHNPAEQTAQESVVTFNSQSTPGYDSDFDSYFIQGYAPDFYSRAGSENLAYNTLPVLSSQTIIPFSFVKTAGSDYSIEATKIENFPTMEIYLTDLKLNKVQNLVENPVYTFTSFSGDDPARFLLSFGHIVGNDEKTFSNNGIYAYENNLFIINPGKAKLELYSMNGKRLHSEEIDSPGLFKTTLCLPTAYYVVRLTTGTKVVVSKVFLTS